MSLRRAIDSIDHLILGAATLADGLAFVRAELGVDARLGGRHPGAGTENAIVALGPRRYLEILAPAPDADELAPGLAPLRALERPRLWGWAISTDDAGALAARADRLGVVHSPVTAGDRVRPDGTFVRWRNLGVQLAMGEAAPFFIEWSVASSHPADDAPAGGRLRGLTVVHPDPAAATAALAKLGWEIEVVRGDLAGIRAEIETLDGAIVPLV